MGGAVVSELKRVEEVYQIQDGITATALMKVPDMIVVDETSIDEKMYFEELRQCIVLALDSLKKARETEGNNLREDILKRLDLISNEVNNMANRATTLVDEYRKKLEKRIEELGATNIVDENRIATEIVLFADKTSICEEVTRLKRHINSFKEMLDSEGAIGKKLDFLTQEMNREVNTIASKANCIDIVDGIIVAKNEIENIREQVQNIE